MLSDWLKSFGKKIDTAVLIDISNEESIKRLSARRKCAKCGKIWNLVTSPKPPTENTCDCGGELIQRKDDTSEAIKKRLEVYHQTTGKLVELLEKKGILMKVDGTKPIEKVTTEIVEGLKKLK
jgi:adenylate kinase